MKKELVEKIFDSVIAPVMADYRKSAALSITFIIGIIFLSLIVGTDTFNKIIAIFWGAVFISAFAGLAIFFLRAGSIFGSFGNGPGYPADEKESSQKK
jgi:hypothetical protein